MSLSKIRGRKAHSLENAIMRNTLYTSLAALMVVGSSFTVGCDGHEEGYGEVHLDITARALACGTAPLPESFADTKICIIHADADPNKVNGDPTKDWTCLPMDLSEGEDDANFANLDLEGTYLMAFAKEVADAGYMAEYTVGAFPTSAIVTLVRGVPKSVGVILTTDCQGVTGSGKGDGCLELANSEGSMDEDSCENLVVEVDGEAVTLTDDAEECPDGKFMSGLDAKVSVFAADCDGVTATVTTEIKEDDTTTVPIDFESNTTTPGDDGDVCGHTQKATDQGLVDVTDPCDFNYLQLPASSEPVESVNPPTECGESADHFFESVPANLYDVVVACGGLSGQFKVSVLAGELSKVYFTLQEPIVDDAPCVIKHGLPLDWYYTMADMGMYLGRGENGSCKALSPVELATVSVSGWTSLTGPACVDSSCPIEVTGLEVTMGEGGWDDYATMEQRVFEVTVTDGVDSWIVYIDSVNGYAFQPPEATSNGGMGSAVYKVYSGWHRGDSYVPYMLFPSAPTSSIQ